MTTHHRWIPERPIWRRRRRADGVKVGDLRELPAADRTCVTVAPPLAAGYDDVSRVHVELTPAPGRCTGNRGSPWRAWICRCSRYTPRSWSKCCSNATAGVRGPDPASPCCAAASRPTTGGCAPRALSVFPIAVGTRRWWYEPKTVIRPDEFPRARDSPTESLTVSPPTRFSNSLTPAGPVGLDVFRPFSRMHGRTNEYKPEQ